MTERSKVSHPGERSDDGKITIKMALTAFAIITQLGALIWGAAKISSSVDALTSTTAELRAAINTITQTVNEVKIQEAIHSTEIKQLKDKIQ